MATIPALSHPKFIYLFLAVYRADIHAKPSCIRVAADSELCARKYLTGRFILLFAGRLPVTRIFQGANNDE